MKLGIAEIFSEAAKIKNRKDRADYLRKHDSRAIQDLIQYAKHPAIVWDLPAGNPPYKPSELLDNEAMLYNSVRKLAIFVNGNGSNLKPARLEQLFIQILEVVTPADAELLLLVKDGHLPKGISPTVVDDVWPGLIPSEETSSEEESE